MIRENVIIRYGLVELQMISNQLGSLFRFQYGSIRRLFDDLILRTQLIVICSRRRRVSNKVYVLT